MGGPGSGPHSSAGHARGNKYPRPTAAAKKAYAEKVKSQDAAKAVQGHGNTMSSHDHTVSPMSPGKNMTNSGHFGDSYPGNPGGAFTRD